MEDVSFDLIVFFVILTIIGNWIAWDKGFFRIYTQKDTVDISWKQTANIFLIYLVCLFASSYVLSYVFHFIGKDAPLETKLVMANYVQLGSTFTALFGLFLYMRTMPFQTIKDIWKQKTEHSKSIAYDFFLGASTWLISFPTVVVVGELADFILLDVLHFSYQEQVAVRYLKAMQSYTSLMLLALITIVIIAPVIEEFLFRGVLQNAFKRKFGSKASILLSSFCFAMFHYSSSQGASNISLLLSLFVFAYFLGFVYDKQRSLFASIGLHMAFNLISTLRILFTS